MKRLQHRVKAMESIAVMARYFKWWAWLAIFAVSVSVGAWMAVME